MNPKICHYEVLGISEKATKQEIAAAFNKLADKFENDKDKYLEISQAFNCLNDPKMKYDYDYKKRNQPNK